VVGAQTLLWYAAKSVDERAHRVPEAHPQLSCSRSAALAPAGIGTILGFREDTASMCGIVS